MTSFSIASSSMLRLPVDGASTVTREGVSPSPSRTTRKSSSSACLPHNRSVRSWTARPTSLAVGASWQRLPRSSSCSPCTCSPRLDSSAAKRSRAFRMFLRRETLDSIHWPKSISGLIRTNTSVAGCCVTANSAAPTRRGVSMATTDSRCGSGTLGTSGGFTFRAPNTGEIRGGRTNRGSTNSSALGCVPDSVRRIRIDESPSSIRSLAWTVARGTWTPPMTMPFDELLSMISMPSETLIFACDFETVSSRSRTSASAPRPM